jgi:predicted nucleotidyltransferase
MISPSDSDQDRPSGRFVLRLDPGLHAALRSAARAAGVSLNEYCARRLSAPGREGVDGAAEVVGRASQVVGAELAGVVLFGSWARGEATAESDVDVLIVLRRGRVTRELYRAWDAAPVEWEGRPVEPHFVTLPEPGTPPSGLWAEVAIDGVVLYEVDVELSRRLAEVRRRIAEGALVRRWSNGHAYWVAA